MSKSLKNFISINDYLNSNLTSQPSDDFRLYCLSYKYYTTLTYSTTRIHEASKLRYKFESFFSSIKILMRVFNMDISIQSNELIVPEVRRRSTIESKKLLTLYDKIQYDIDISLKDDFDTPNVLHLLSQLVGESQLYLNIIMANIETSTTNTTAPTTAATPTGTGNINTTTEILTEVSQPIEPLLAVTTYIVRILTILGLQFPQTHSPLSLQCNTTTNTSTLSTTIVDTIVEYRGSVRTAALQGLKVLRGKKKTGTMTETEVQLEQSLLQIMSACDGSRESLGKALGIKIEDISGASSKWTQL